MCQRVEKMAKAEDWSLPVLASHLRTVLWKWLAWEPAHHCIANKLRTTLGKPQDTFTSIEGNNCIGLLYELLDMKEREIDLSIAHLKRTCV